MVNIISALNERTMSDGCQYFVSLFLEAKLNKDKFYFNILPLEERYGCHACDFLMHTVN